MPSVVEDNRCEDEPGISNEIIAVDNMDVSVSTESYACPVTTAEFDDGTIQSSFVKRNQSRIFFEV